MQTDKHTGEKEGGRECTARACGDREQAAMPEGTPSVPCGPGAVLGTEIAISSKRRQKRRKTRRADTLGRETGRNKEALIIQRERSEQK